ncbi:MAG: hypothetical protein U0487_02915 [Patescibacteria group bacterium]
MIQEKHDLDQSPFSRLATMTDVSGSLIALFSTTLIFSLDAYLPSDALIDFQLLDAMPSWQKFVVISAVLLLAVLLIVFPCMFQHTLRAFYQNHPDTVDELVQGLELTINREHQPGTGIIDKAALEFEHVINGYAYSFWRLFRLVIKDIMLAGLLIVGLGSYNLLIFGPSVCSDETLLRILLVAPCGFLVSVLFDLIMLLILLTGLVFILAVKNKWIDRRNQILLLKSRPA